MRKTILLTAASLIVGVMVALAQGNGHAAREQAERMVKEQWTTAPGLSSIEQQLARVYEMQREYDNNMHPRYMMAEAMCKGSSYDAAKREAVELARQQLAGQIQTEVKARMDIIMANSQQGREAATNTRVMSVARNLVAQSLGKAIPVVEAYRTLANGQTEVLVRLAYDADEAGVVAQKAVVKGKDLQQKKVKATYTYYAPESVTVEVAKRTALDRARLVAIADAFGTIVSQSNATIMVDNNGKADSRFFSLGGSDVRGEWIETIGEPVYQLSYEQNILVVKVEVDGIIRETDGPDIDITAKILRNGTEEKFESSEFRSGDDMYLYFQSPVDGWLVVYMLDETTQQVFCLLPYKNSGDGAYFIAHDKPYILFSSKHDHDNPGIVDEYVMTCQRENELNDIYVIFSPNAISKANSSEVSNVSLPRQLSFEDFTKWLSKLRNRDKDVIVVNKPVLIQESK